MKLDRILYLICLFTLLFSDIGFTQTQESIIILQEGYYEGTITVDNSEVINFAKGEISSFNSNMFLDYKFSLTYNDSIISDGL